jgi:subtilisin family serine protease
MTLYFLKRMLLLAVSGFSIWLPSQSQTLKDNWQNLDLKTDSVFGISTEKAYSELLKGKKHVTVIVAVIDVGVDINHEDLKSVIWTNTKEIAGNHVDDDKNGYTDDIHGWNFIGGPNGDVEYENYEYVRLVRQERPLYENADTTKFNPGQLDKYHDYLKMKAKLGRSIKRIEAEIKDYDEGTVFIDSLLIEMNIKNPSISDFKNYKPKNATQKQIIEYVINNDKEKDFSVFRKQKKDEDLRFFHTELDYSLNINYDPRHIVGDDSDNDYERFYGNGNVNGPDEYQDHGTHVSGIIGAVRNNNIGIQGVADDVLIMPIRTVPDAGDERDKDLANAIRYAADNGAKIINMSIGKDYVYDKKVVDEAVKYAVTKDVLIVHAAGNENADLDKKTFYPSKMYEDGSGMASAWIEVGASDSKDDETLKANFSSYGKTYVDVFAPGVDIKSTIRGSKYGLDRGTSMACPVVAGLAALIRSYYPKLTAIQVKEIILNSVAKVNHEVILPGKGKVPFSELCNSGGIANAYNALKLAATY